MDHGHEQAPQGCLAGSAAVRERLLNLVLGVASVASAVLDRIALFIDGANLFATARTLGFDIDARRLVNEFQDRGNLLRAVYYIVTTEQQRYSSIRPLMNWLDFNGYTVVTKVTKEFVDAGGRRRLRGRMDLERVVDAMELAEHIDQMVLFSGDGNSRSSVGAMQRHGVRVTVVSTIASQPPIIATSCDARLTRLSI